MRKRPRAVFLLLALSVLTIAGPWAGARPAGLVGKGNRPATRAANARANPDAPLAARKQDNDRRLGALRQRKARARAAAEREVAGWSAAKLAEHGWKPGQEKLAVKARTKQLFGRHERRALRAAEAVDRLLTREATMPSGKNKRALQRDQAELVRAAGLNRRLGSEKFQIQVARTLMQKKAPGLSKRISWLKRDSQTSPGTPAGNLGKRGRTLTRTDHIDPRGSTMWRPRKAKRVTSSAIYEGPWAKVTKRIAPPTSKRVLRMVGYRDRDADGVHPAVFVTDGKSKQTWKLKFLGDRERKVLSSEAVASRLLYAMGYETQQVHRLRNVRLDPRAVLAAFRHKNRLGFRIPERNRLGLRPGKYGYSPFRMGPQVKSVTLTSGKVLPGPAGARLLRRARKRTELLDTIAFVTVHAVDAVAKGGKAESIGPFSPDAAEHIDRREMRGLSILTSSWLHGNDVRMNNLRVDALGQSDGSVELIHRLSDTGGMLNNSDPNGMSWTVDVDLGADRLHSDHNRVSLRAFDRTTADDARWAVRKLGSLSEAQIVSAVAAGADSWPVARLVSEKLIARRDALVRGFGLEAELGLLRPKGVDTRLTVRGPGAVTVRDHKGAQRTIELGAGRHQVVDGRLVELD